MADPELDFTSEVSATAVGLFVAFSRYHRGNDQWNTSDARSALAGRFIAEGYRKFPGSSRLRALLTSGIESARDSARRSPDDDPGAVGGVVTAILQPCLTTPMYNDPKFDDVPSTQTRAIDELATEIDDFLKKQIPLVGEASACAALSSYEGRGTRVCEGASRERAKLILRTKLFIVFGARISQGRIYPSTNMICPA